MKSPKGVTMYKILLFLSLSVSVCAQDSYYERFQNLIGGSRTISEHTRAQIKAASQEVDMSIGIAGVQFGQSMDEVIALWGQPRGIFAVMPGEVKLHIGGSQFHFQDNKLNGVTIHGVDLPNFSIASGKLAIGMSCPELTDIFPGSIPSSTFNHIPNLREIELSGGKIKVRVNLMKNKIITISVYQI
jgi:hypothetical protein